MPKAVQANYIDILLSCKNQKAQKKTSISGQKTRIYSRFLRTVKTSLLRSARSLDNVAPNVRPQADIKLQFWVPSPS